jgi:hypothetical protein
MHQAKRKEIYERLHPQTKRGAAGGAATKAKAGKANRQVGEQPRYTADAAKKTGKSERAVQREAARGAAISDVASLAGTSLDKGDELDAVQAKDVVLIQHTTDLRMRAEIRAGELLAEMKQRKERHEGKGQPREVLRSHAATSVAPKLSDLGVTKTRWTSSTAGAPGCVRAPLKLRGLLALLRGPIELLVSLLIGTSHECLIADPALWQTD